MKTENFGKKIGIRTVAVLLCMCVFAGSFFIAPKVSAAEATVTVVDDNDPAIQYEGWNLWTEGDYTQHYSTQVGATITYSFYGTGIELFCDKVSNGPIVSVAIDGEAEDADQYAPTKQSDALFYSKQNLEQGDHTVVITLTDRSNKNAAPIGGGSLQATLTYLRVTDDPNAGTLPPLPEEKTVTRVEDTDSGIQYTSGWALWQDGSYTQHYCRTEGDYFTYSFVGTGIELFCDKARNGPIMYVAIDDEDYVEADQYTDGKISDALFYERQNLSYGDHTVKVTFSEKANPAASAGNLQATLTYMQVTVDPDAVNTDITYTRHYDDGQTGVWEGAKATVVEDPADPSNEVLELTDFTGDYTRDASAPALEDGTLSMRVMVSSDDEWVKNLGFVYRAENAENKASFVAEQNGWKIFRAESTEFTDYALLQKCDGIPTDEWVEVRLAFYANEVELAVNGYRFGKITVDGQPLAAGSFGFYNPRGARILVDDITFTNRRLAMGTPFVAPKDPDEGHVSVKEDYSLMQPDWTAGTLENNALKLVLAAGGIAANNNETMKTLANAVNTFNICTDSKGRFGVVFNYTSNTDYNAIYSVTQGEFRLKSAASGLDKVIASNSAVLKANTRYEVVVIHTGKDYQLYINAALLAEGEETGLSVNPGTLGMYNAASEQAEFRVYSCGMREVIYYFNDFEDASRIGNWIGGANSSAAHTQSGMINGSGELQVSLGRHENLINTEVPKIANGSYEFDLYIQKSEDATYKGCLGFLCRTPEPSIYQALYYENANGGSSWWWLASGYGTVSSSKVLEEETRYHVRLVADGNKLSLYVNDELYAEKTHDQFKDTVEGFFGFRQQYFANSIRVDNLKIMEKVELALSDREEVPITIQSSEMEVTMDEAFPRVITYRMNGKTLLGGQQKAYGVKLNNTLRYPVVNCEKISDKELNYSLLFPTVGVTLKLKYAVNGSQLRMDVTDVIETGSFRVQTIEFENSALVSTKSGDPKASFASVRNPGGWYEWKDYIYEDLSEVPENELVRAYRSYGMLASDGLAATINNSGIETYERLNSSVVATRKGNVASLGDGILTVRTPLDLQEGTKRTPWSIVLVCEDYNEDGEVNWQDAAAAYRTIRNEVKGMDTMKDNMMWIAMNFASLAQTTFASSLDLGKTIYNYTDGFGQMIMHKGYAAEGHDDSHGDYAGHVNLRAGGADGFNAAMEEGKNYNIQYGIHINVSEHIPDGLSFNEDVMNRPLSANWGWIDQAYWVDEQKDILSRNRYNNFVALRNELPDLSFIYVDIYGGSTWMADNLAQELNDLGFIVGTEFGGSMEQGAAFTHWGRDNSYPNKGMNSEIIRYFKNNLDVFVTNALFNSSIMPRVATWSNKNNINEATEDFFNHNLPRKYMQHFDVLDIEEDYVIFSDGVKSEKTGSGEAGDNNVVTLTKNGCKIAEWTWWNLNASVNTEADTTAGDAIVFIPWYGENSTTKNPDDADKIYHWNANGGTTTWQVPDNWKNLKAADVYQLSGDNKVKVATVAITNGEITLSAEEKTGYVLYPAGSAAPRVAGNFGSGTPIENPNFDATDLSGWTSDTTDTSAITVAKNPTTWETYLEMSGNKGDTAAISQTMTNLAAGKRNTVYFFAELEENTQLDVTVEIAGKTYHKTAFPTDMKHYDFSKFWDTEYQKVRVAFDVPEGVTTAKLTVTATFKRDDAKVNVDEFRVWTNPSVTPDTNDAGYKNYILYEDFENVEQGYGVFAYAYPSGQYSHLAEYREEANQFTNYVLSGNYSLKTNEFGRVGETLRTIPSEVHFERNTEYEISFQYETGIADTYMLSVKRPDGTSVYEHIFEATELDREGKTVTATFETGDYDDYYVAISQVRSTEDAAPPAVVPEGSRMEFRYMSLDNVSVRKLVEDMPVDKELLKALIDRATEMLSDAAKYVTAKWPELTEKLAEGQRVYADTEATQEGVNEVAEALRSAIMAQRLKADKTELEKLLKEAETVDASLYTEKTAQTFLAALTNANAVLTDATLSEDDQKIVDEAVKALADALNNLKLADDGDGGDADGDKDNNGSQTGGKDVPKTSDSTRLVLWISLAALALLMTVLLVGKKNRDRHHG